MCGSDAVAWQFQKLVELPLRTLSHATAPLSADIAVKIGACTPCITTPGDWVPSMVSKDAVEIAHRAVIAATNMCEAEDDMIVPSAGRYSLAFLSKFGNPVVQGGDRLFGDLAARGVRLHICTGDAYLTLQVQELLSCGVVAGRSHMLRAAPFIGCLTRNGYSSS